MEKFETNNARRMMPFLILPILLLAAAAVIAYFLLMKPAEKTQGTVVPETQDAPSSTGATEELAEPGENYDFDDGLRNPASAQQPELDEFGEGIASIEIFEPDIDGDGANDRITKTRHENGTAHFYYEYKVELNADGGFKDITPQDFRTVEGSDCSLQKLRFVFIPSFQVVKIARDFEDTWITPAMAIKTIYKIDNGSLKTSRTQALKKICNVSDLF